MHLLIISSTVSFPTGCMFGGLSPGRSWGFFSSPPRSDPLWVSPNLLSSGVPGVKRSGREGDHSPPTSAEVKNTWSYTSTPPNKPLWSSARLKHRDNVNLYLYCELPVYIDVPRH
jgi:hypothetical protein